MNAGTHGDVDATNEHRIARRAERMRGGRTTAESGRGQRCRRTAVLAASPRALHRSRTLVAAWLTAWEREELVPAATVIVDALVENVLAHTDSLPTVTAEIDGATVTIAVHDTARAPAVRREPPGADRIRVSGLAVVAAISRIWGSTPTATGKAVWAVLGPECRLV